MEKLQSVPLRDERDLDHMRAGLEYTSKSGVVHHRFDLVDVVERVNELVEFVNTLMEPPPGALGDLLVKFSHSERRCAQLQAVIDRAAKAWLSIDGVPGWNGDLADAMQAAVNEIERVREAVRVHMDERRENATIAEETLWQTVLGRS